MPATRDNCSKAQQWEPERRRQSNDPAGQASVEGIKASPRFVFKAATVSMQFRPVRRRFRFSSMGTGEVETINLTNHRFPIDWRRLRSTKRVTVLQVVWKMYRWRALDVEWCTWTVSTFRGQ